jgi:CheY-like chemotaxis protein
LTASGGTEETNPGGGKRYRILVIEDNPADVHLIREALSDSRLVCDIHAIDDGEAALEHLLSVEGGQRPCPDAVLLDLNLPKVTGDTLLQKIRQSKTMSAVPVIVLTSSDSPRDRGQAERLGASAYIRKPSSLDEFLAIGGEVRRRLTGA